MGGSYIDENGLAHRGDEHSFVSNASAQNYNDGSYIDENGLAHRGNVASANQSYYTDTLPGTPDTPDDNSNQLPLKFVSQEPTPYWEPDKIVERYDWYRANPDKEPEISGPTKQETETAYNYLANTKFKNVPRNDWEMTDYDTDPYYQNVISKWDDPRKPQTKEDAATISQAEELMKPKEMQGTFEDLNLARKTDVMLIPTGTITEGAPSISKYSQAIIPALGQASVGKVIGEVAKFAISKVLPKAAAGWVGWLPTTLSIGTAALGAYTSITGKEAPPWFQKTARALDIVGTTAEKLLVGLPATFKALHPEIDSNTEWGYKNPNLTKKEGHNDPLQGLGEAVDNFLDMYREFVRHAFGRENVVDDINLKAAWTTGAMGFEENPQAGISGIIDNVVNKIIGLPTAARDEYFRSELGINEPIKADLTTEEAYRLIYNAVDEKLKLVNPNTGKLYTTAEIEDELVLPFATAQYGVSGAKSDLIGQEVLDPTNYAGNIQNSIVNTYAKVTGNKPLQTATEINAGNNYAPFPLNALSSKQKTGGLNELSEIHKKVLRGELGNNPVKVDTLSDYERIIAGVTPEGKYKEYEPAQPSQRTGIIGKIENAVQNLASLTPVAKAELLLKQTVDMINGISLLSDTPEAMLTNMKKMADLIEVSPDDSINKIYGTAEQRTSSEALKAIVSSKQFEAITSQWNATESMRNSLNLLADQTGKKPAEIIQGIIQNPQEIKQLIQDTAAKNNGSIMGQMLTDDGTLIIDQFQVFTDKKNPMPYTLEQVTTAYSKASADMLSDYVTNLYDVKPDNLAIRLSDMMKKFQSIFLLGFSPSYLANNYVNNIVTRAAVGVFGFPNVDKWTDRFGIIPVRMYDSMAEFRGANSTDTGVYATINQKLKNAKRKGDVVDKASDLLSSVGSQTPITKLNGKFEGAESARANVVGQMQYMAKAWRVGKGFDELPPLLKQQIDSIIPNGSRIIYSAIQSGLNIDEIESKLFGEYVKPDMQTILDSIVQDKFPIDSDIVVELFGKTGKLHELQTLLDNAKTPEERAKVIESVRNRSKDVAKMYMDNQIISEAENIRNDIATSGDKNQSLNRAMEYLSYTAISREDQWLRSRDSYRDAYAKKVRESMTPGAWMSYIASIASRNRAEWNTFNAREKQVYAGIIRALGFTDNISAEYLSLVTDYQSNWNNFYKYQQQKINEYYGGNITWEDYLADTDRAYDEHFQSEMLIQEKLNESFLRGYSASGFDVAPIRELQNRIITIRHEMHDMQVDIRQRTRAATKNMERADADKIRNEMYLAFEPEYNGKIEEIANLQSQIGAEIGKDPVEKAREQSGRPIESIPPQEPISELDKVAQKLKAKIILQDADVIRSNAETDFENAIHETEADRQAKAERPEYYTRDKIRQAFVDSGLSEEKVNLYMELFDAREKQWNKDNPGKNMYKEALRVINITKDEMQGDPLLEISKIKSKTIDDPILNQYGANKINEFLDRMEEVIRNNYPNILETNEVKTWLLGQGINKDVIEWSTMNDYLDIQHEIVTDYQLLVSIDKDRQRIMNLTDINSPEFRTWFEGSKVVKADGKPKIVYHGDVDKNIFLGNVFSSDKYNIASQYGNKLHEVYLSIKNPLVINAKNRNWADLPVPKKHKDVIKTYYNSISIDNLADYAKQLGYDGLIVNNVRDQYGVGTQYVTFDPTQIKSINNTGSWNPNNPNMLYQSLNEKIKGEFQVIDGDTAIRLLESKDISTMVHESGHLFRRTLNDKQMAEYAQWAGFKSADEYLDYDNRFWDGKLTEEESKRYSEAEEKFARGWEQYLIEGKAPTPTLARVFKAFTEWMLDIYKAVKRALTKDYSGQKEFIFNGKPLDIKAEINGVRLVDIFDSMLAEQEANTAENTLSTPSTPEMEALKLASAIEQFDAGNPITLEQLKEIATPAYQNTEFTPDENIIPDIDEMTTNEIYAKKINPIMHGEYKIAARVYKDGFPIAYYPYNLRMKEIPYQGKVYDVLGIDIDNVDQYLFWDGEQVITVNTKQDLSDLDLSEELPTIPVDQQPNNITMPTGEAYAELISKYLDPIFDELPERYEKELARNKVSGSFSSLDTNSKVELYKYLHGVKDDLAATKYNAVKYGEMKRDQALLNYNKRYGFDTYLTAISPYQFWYTRSMLNWAKRMIDKPVWFTTYARLKEKEELFARDETPTRLDGRNLIPMPYLEDWMGGGLYIDILSQFFPFAQFLNKASDHFKDKNILNNKVESLLKEQMDEGIITSKDYLESVKSKNTPTWNTAYAIISDQNSIDPSLGGLAQQYLSLPFLVDWALKKERGKEGEIANLPITRTGLSLQTLTKGIPVVETAGKVIGGAMTLPEQGLRKLYGLDYNELGTYGDYAIKKQLSQMGNSGEISREEMLDAQRNMSGPAYEEAYRRQREELMLRTQGAAAIDAMKAFIQGDATITDVLQALFIAPFGGSIYPEDEYQLRQQSAEREQAFADKASGKNPNAVNEFYNKYPAFVGRSASFIDDTEALNKYVAYQNITNAYYNMPYAQQQAISMSLGTDFYNAIINKETKNYKAVPYEDLLTWEYAIRGDIPNLPASEINKVKEKAPKITYYTQPVVDEVETFKQLTKQNFPANIEEMNRYYYTLPKDERYAYLNLHPEVGEFQQFKRNYRNANQGYDTYLEDYSAFQNEIMAVRCYAEMAESVRNDLEYSKVTGKELRGASINQLKHLYGKYADPNFNTFDEFVEILKVYE